jgi:hypothetical protein
VVVWAGRWVMSLAESSSGYSISIRLPFAYQMQRMLNCLDLGTIASEDLCGEGGHSSGRLPEAS